MLNIKLSSIVSISKQEIFQSDTISKAINYMNENQISSVVITDIDRKPIGIFTQHDALHTIANNINDEITLGEVMTKNPFYIYDDMDIHDAYMLMERRGYRHLVVVNSVDKYMGIVTEGDFLRHCGFEESTKFKNVSDSMSETMLKVSEDMEIDKVASQMSNHNCSYAVIMNGEIPIGIINEHDIINNKDKNIKLKDVVKKPVYFIKNTILIQEAIEKMKYHGVHQLLVTDDEENLLGIITRHNILKAMHGAYFELLVQKIEDKTIQERKLKQLVNIDQLTGLPNRMFFKSHLNQSVLNAIKKNQMLAVVILDLDRFKEINDSYGHTIGDELLKTISNRLKSRLKKGDMLARLGGDEFVIILENISTSQDASTVTQNIINHISSKYRLSNGIDVHVSTSAGIVIAPNNTTVVEELLQYADSALYNAKKDKRGGYKYYCDDMTKEAQTRMQCENDLRQAIVNEEFELYYQPQVHIKSNKITSCEALIRWNKPEFGLVPPDDFIPIAEESGLINDIGEWVIKQACYQGKIWADLGHRITIAVNVSANQMRYQNLSSIIDNSIRNSGFEASKLEIEITESAIMQREEEAVSKLHEFKAKGIHLAIDDFGTGYSSLAYLKRFPIDVLKIDKSFIDDIPYDKDDMAIAIAIINMGKALGFQVLAEGVENIEQLEFLKEKGCDFYQGYYKSKPIKADEFMKLLQEQNR